MVFPEDLEKIAQLLDSLNLENRVVVEDEIPFVDGRTIRRFSAQIRDELDTYFGRLYIFEDISDRKRAEQALQESQRWLQAVTELNPNILYVYDLIEQRNVYVNREVFELLGVERRLKGY